MTSTLCSELMHFLLFETLSVFIFCYDEHFVTGMKIATPSEVVIVNFSAKSESMHPFFATHPICRSFNYSGSNFSQLTRDDVVSTNK